MDTLVKEQQECYKEIERIKINFGKDSDKRKTVVYCDAKLNLLESYWEKFVNTDLEIQKLKSTNQKHGYFTENYYDRVEEFYDHIKSIIQDKKEEMLEKEKQTAATVHELKLSTDGDKVKGGGEDDITFKRDSFSVKLIRVQTETIRLLERLLEAAEKEVHQEHSPFFYQHKLNTIQTYWNKIASNHIEIVATVCDGDDDYLTKDTYQSIEDKYHEVVIKIQEQIGTTRRSEDEVKLPRLILPTFEGDYQAWSSFHDIFIRLIHNNSRLGNAEKMHYLKTHLRKEASNLLQHLTISNANYKTAWQLLNDRYNNKRKICATQIQLLLSQPKLDVESANGIRKLHDVTKESLHSLSNLGINTETWAPLVTHIIIQKLDVESHKLYEQNLEKPREIPTFEGQFRFLEARFQSLELLKDARKKEVAKNNKISQQENQKYKTYHATTAKQWHKIFKCPKFIRLSIQARNQYVQSNKLCTNCLSHKEDEKCFSKFSCSTCKQRHHTLLHQEKQEKFTAETKENTKVQSFQSKLKNNILLATAIVKARSVDGKVELLRALIDPGSQASFVSESTAQLLGLPRKKTRAEISGIGQTNSGIVRHKIQLDLTPRFPSTFSIRLEALILPKLTQLLPDTDVIDDMEVHSLENFILADPTYSKPGPINLIIGADIFGSIICNGIRKLNNGLFSQHTEFGWILSGPLNNSTDVSQQTITSCISRLNLDKTLRKFWEIEDIDTSATTASKTNAECETHFKETFKRGTDGTYTVRIPFKQNQKQLGESKRKAMARLFQNEKKFQANKKLAVEYSNFLQEYLTLKHMTLITTPSNDGYYLPHQAVFKEDSSTTKLRVVFDASAKTTSGLSLNDTMHTGPKLQNELSDIILRWRKHRYVYSADIEKMYRQIRIHKDDQKYLKILWRPSAKEPVREYQLNTVTYGTAAAPFLAIRTLHQLAKDEERNYPEAAEILRRDFYVDDVLTGANSLREAKLLQMNLTKLLASGGFKLRKWITNQQSLLQSIPEELREKNKIEISDGETVKTLGIHWLPSGDYFQFRVNLTNPMGKTTKRIVLSDIARLFDPIGWLSPIIIRAKLIMQEIWLAQIDWDQQLPEEIHQKWTQFQEDLKEVHSIQIPRWIKFTAGPTIELHGFCDASEKAYAAVIYSRVYTAQGDTIVTMLTSKTKVAPIKTQTTTPKLELCAAVLLSKLLIRTKVALHIKEIQMRAWTDSQIALAWIKGEQKNWMTFVANRVQEIRKNTDPAIWDYIRTDQNPADCASRGLTVKQLKIHPLWWTGPQWLMLPQEDWPKHENVQLQIPRESIYTLVNHSATILPSNIFERFSDLNRLVRISSYCRRFLHHVREKIQKNRILQASELHSTLIKLIQIVQKEHFHSEIKLILQKKPLPRSSKILPLTPFIDEEGVLRLGGRLENSLLSYNQKHPIILPQSHPFSKLIIKDAHTKTLHGGNQATLAYLRRKYWIINAKRTIRATLHQCTTCFRFKAPTEQQLMGNLPAARVIPAKPFSNTGVDYAGPFNIRVSKGRGTKSYKGYISIFICLCTKAIHLEAVSDLTTDAFLAAYKRFISRRGLCFNIYSDCGTTFVGAKNDLEAQFRDALSKTHQEAIEVLANKGTKWHFIPPASPHFGGLWEAGVKSTKYHLKRIAGSINFTFEELSTLLAQIEACLNSRPLCPLSNDADDLTVLTPGHFLIGGPLLMPPEPYQPEKLTSYITRWKLLNKLRDDFWKVWTTEYLTRLQHRTKWQQKDININIGDVVLLKDENCPPAKWALGRIIDTHPGKDGLVRVCTIKTSKNTIKRPISKLCKLPFLQTDFPNQTELEQNEFPEQGQPATSNQRHVTATPITVTEKRKRTNTTRIHPTSIPLRPPIDQLRQAALPNKRKKSTLLTVLLCLNCVLPIFGLSRMQNTEKQFIQIEPFDHNPGIYLENIASLHLVNNVWNTVVYYDLETYYQQLHGFDECLNKLSYLCNQTVTYNYYCTAVLTELQHKVAEMRNNNLLLHKRNGNHLVKRRQERSPLDFIGSLQNSLFGVLDQNYAKNIEGEINKLKGNENYLLTLAKNYTSITEVTTNVLKRTAQDIQKQFEVFNAHIQAGLTALQLGEARNNLTQTFNALTAYTNLIIHQYERVQKELIELVLDTHNGKITPFIITPTQLREQIKHIREHISATLLIPGETSQEEVLRLYEIMTAKTRVLDSVIIIRIQIPLPESRRFQLFKAYPIPMKHNKEYFFIEPSSDFLTTNLHRDLYYPMTENELRQCSKIETLGYMCQQNHPIYTTQASLNKCEMELLNHRKPPPFACHIKKTLPSQYWIQLHHSNQWIFVTNEETTINVVCDDHVIIKTLKASGIIQLHNNCRIKHPSMSITAKTITSHHHKTSFLPSTNLSLLLLDSQHKDTTGNSTIPLIHLNTQPLEELHFPKIQDELQTINPHHIHHYVSTYVIIIAIAGIGIWYIYRRMRPCKSASNEINLTVQSFTPKPQQRTNIPSTTSPGVA